MEIINYDKDTRVHGEFPKITKLGACSPNGEMTPFVWKGKLMRLELCDKAKGLDACNGSIHSLIRDVETGEIISRFAEDGYYSSGYLEGDTMYVLSTVRKLPKYCGDTIMLYSSKDLVNWDKRVLFHREGWEFFNTALAKGDDGYVLLLEVDYTPEDDPGKTFTAYFAKSPDMINWEMMPFDTAFPKDMYCGAPYMRYSNGYYYIFLLLPLPYRRYAHYIFRTKDFTQLEVGYHNPILMPSNDDRIISPNAAPGLDIEKIKTNFNINNCDIDMCEWNGKTYINYLLGNQYGTCGGMCEAIYDGPIAEFLESFYR